MIKLAITSALENYLKILLELNEFGGEARVTSIFERFGVTKATVSQTVKRLMKHDLVTKDMNGAILLTNLGKGKAIEVRNCNRVIQGT